MTLGYFQPARHDPPRPVVKEKTKREPLPDIVGLREIAERLDVKPHTVTAWKQRKLLPEADWTISGSPVWLWKTVEPWARETGRLV